MTFFDLFINFLEGFILATFVANYFILDNKIKYVSVIASLATIEITISNYFVVFDFIVIFVIILTLFLGLVYSKKNVYLSGFFICTLALVILTVCNGIALLTISTISEVPAGELMDINNIYYLHMTIIFSKILLTTVLFFLCKKKINNDIQLVFKKWWMLTLIILILLVLTNIILEVVIIRKVNYNAMCVAVALIFFVMAFIFYLFYRVNKESEIIIEYKIKENNIKNQEKNFKLINSKNKEMERNLHNSKYFLMLLKKKLKNNELDEVNDLIDKRMEELLSTGILVNTGNYIFDYYFNYGLKKYGFRKQKVKIMVLVDICKYIESDSFLKLCDLIMREIEDDSRNNRYISFEIQELGQFIKLKVSLLEEGNWLQTKINWENNINQLHNYLGFDYDINHNQGIIDIVLLFSIDNKVK